MDPKEMRSQLLAVYGQEKASAGLLFGFDWSIFAAAFAVGFVRDRFCTILGCSDRTALARGAGKL
jgi:hypothetical protein